MPINSQTRQNQNFSQEKPARKQNLSRPTVKSVSRTKTAPSAKVK